MTHPAIEKIREALEIADRLSADCMQYGAVTIREARDALASLEKVGDEDGAILEHHLGYFVGHLDLCPEVKNRAKADIYWGEAQAALSRLALRAKLADEVTDYTLEIIDRQIAELEGGKE